MTAIDDKCMEKEPADKIIKREPIIKNMMEYDAVRKNPIYRCFVCDGYNYNCEQYKIKEMVK